MAQREEQPSGVYWNWEKSAFVTPPEKATNQPKLTVTPEDMKKHFVQTNAWSFCAETNKFGRKCGVLASYKHEGKVLCYGCCFKLLSDEKRQATGMKIES